MMHRPIILKNVSLSFSKKNCFEDFSSQIYCYSRIAIIGRNGTGKSSLLTILRGKLRSYNGEVIVPDDLCIGYVEQTISDYNDLSGGQRFNKRLSEALALSPDLLLLDEPTNHLDKNNRKSLMRMLDSYQNTLIIASHDTELLRRCTDTLWHIDNNKIHEFSGSYDDYIKEVKQKRKSIEKQLAFLESERKDTHNALMKEQERAAKSKIKGQKSIDQRKWPTVVSKGKANRAAETSGKKKSAIDKKKRHLTEKLSDLRLPEIILPTFSLTSEDIGSGTILSISRADIGYNKDKIILKNVSLDITGKERIAISGKNGSGKSTLLKAIWDKSQIFTSGSWHLPGFESIGYLDQHYSNLDLQSSVIDHLKRLKSNWNETELRRHLSRFLFRKNQEVLQTASNLSGGEKARLSLSLIAAKTPRLLLLDEITNNLDLETKEHVIQVVKEYPGAMIIISHEEDFLKSIFVDHIYEINDGTLLH